MDYTQRVHQLGECEYDDLGWRWFQIDDLDRWRDTAAMIEIMIITTLNILQRDGLLDYKKRSSVKDLGTVSKMLGELVHACINPIDEVDRTKDDQEHGKLAIYLRQMRQEARYFDWEDGEALLPLQ